MEEIRIGIILWDHWLEGSKSRAWLMSKAVSWSGCCLQRCVYFAEIHQVVSLWYVYSCIFDILQYRSWKVVLGHLQEVRALWHTAVDAGLHTLREPGPSLLGVNIYLEQTLVPGSRSTALGQYELYEGHSVSWLKKTSWLMASLMWIPCGEEVRQLPMWTVSQSKFQHLATPGNWRW